MAAKVVNQKDVELMNNAMNNKHVSCFSTSGCCVNESRVPQE
jgi:hypothetical protein